MTDWARADAFISTAPTTTREQRVAAAAVAVLLIVFCATAPYAQAQLAAVPAFIPLNQAAFFISDLITAVLFLAQVPHLRSRALVVLASGYLFDALMIIPHTLTFPGLFSATGLLDAGEQTTAWIYMFWHSGFPLFVVAYALIRQRPEHDRLNGSIWLAAITGVVAVVALVCALTAIATLGQHLLPPVMAGTHYTPYQRTAIAVTWLFSVAALYFLYRRRGSSALDLWLSVVMCAWVFDVALSGVVNHARFDVGFYAGRLYGLVAASFVLVTLLVESSYLYAKVQSSQEQVAQAQKMEALGQLTGGIAHDFNNLLFAIQGAIEVVEHQVGPIEHQRLQQLLRPAKRAVENGTALTRSLLAFARRQPLEPKNIDVNRLVAGVSELLNRTLGRAVQVETALTAPASQCCVDPNQLENAVLNLAVNARDAMPEGGTLSVRTDYVDEHAAAAHGVPAGRYVVVSVSDTGTGMSQDTLKRAFEPFFTTKSADRGTGLGLSQVYGFVHQSGGHVRISSKIGEGTTVKMFLPAAAEDTHEAHDAAALARIFPEQLVKKASYGRQISANSGQYDYLLADGGN